MPAARKTSSTRLKLALPEVKVTPLPPLPAQLPDDVEALKALLHAQQAAHQQAIDQSVQQAVEQTHEHAMRHIDHLYEQFVLLRQRHFGASTEQSSGQAHLFDEAELLAAASTPGQDQVPLPSQGDAAADAGKKAADKPSRGKRAPLPSGLPRVDIMHDVPEDQRLCPCGTPMVEIGEDISEQLDIVPMQVRVLRLSASATAARAARMRRWSRRCPRSRCPGAMRARICWRCCSRSSSLTACRWRVSNT